MTLYDEILYPSYSHGQTHPDRLAVLGRLFGLNPAEISRCRVLELGSGNGSNLVPMAWALPESEFVGIDLAEVPIQYGQKMAADLGLKNIRQVHGSVMDIDESWGEFDYIIAHGFYSWVPPEVRDQLLALCGKRLRPQGVAFVSYNALPGAHLRLMLREMMLFHVRQVQAPEQKLEQAVSLLSFLDAGQVKADDEYAVWLHKELERAHSLDRSHVFHDDLADFNHPVYFHQFMAHAHYHGLQFLAEADFFEMSDHIFAPNIREVLKGTAHDRVLREQYLDFLKCRRFRQTLLCRKDAKVLPEADPGAIAGFHISSKARKKPRDPRDGGKTLSYSTPKGAKVETDFAPGQAILEVLEKASPAALALEELLSKASLKGTLDIPELCKFLLQLYSAGIVDFRTGPQKFAREAGELPEASPVARWQVERSDTVTSLEHQLLEVEDEIGKRLIRTLNGTRNRKQLADELIDFLKSRGALGEGDPVEIRRKIEHELEENLRKLAKLGLLLA